MFSNSKKIATKLLQKSDKLYICNKYLNLNPAFGNRNSTDFNEQVMIKYLDQRKLENLKYQQQEDKKNLINQEQVDKQNELVSENIDVVQSWVRYNKLIDKDLTLQAACNALYLMCQYNIKDQKVEEKILSTLNDKGIENLSLSNLLDVKMFLKVNPQSKIFKIHSQIEDLIHQKSNLYENIVFVQENGNCINEWENETQMGFIDTVIDTVQDKLGIQVFPSPRDNLLMHNSEMRRLRQSNDEVQVAQPTQLAEQHEEEHGVQLKENKESQVTNMNKKQNKNNSKSKNQQFKQNNK